VLTNINLKIHQLWQTPMVLAKCAYFSGIGLVTALAFALAKSYMLLLILFFLKLN